MSASGESAKRSQASARLGAGSGLRDGGSSDCHSGWHYAAEADPATLLLSSYSLGLALPFVLAAVGLPKLGPLMATLQRWHRPVEITAGLVSVGMGILTYLGMLSRMASLFTWTI